ncbi:MAG: GNAT family N-acetyltransferase [Pseudonocardiales bacterium]|nr:MAG: GNAT family N-acetyltransferase [Pseudonocardiales bacterium]
MGAEIAIRAATEEDAAAIQSIYAPIVTGTFASFEEAAPDVADIVHRMLARPRLPWLVAEDAGRLAGYAYASQHRQRPAYRWSADCAVYLDGGYRRRGIGRGLYRRLVAELTELGYVSLFAAIALPNDASVGLHQAMGFQPIGVFRHVGHKFGSWHDVGWWQRTLPELPPAPGEPSEWAPPG